MRARCRRHGPQQRAPRPLAKSPVPAQVTNSLAQALKGNALSVHLGIAHQPSARCRAERGTPLSQDRGSGLPFGLRVHVAQAHGALSYRYLTLEFDAGGLPARPRSACASTLCRSSADLTQRRPPSVVGGRARHLRAA